MSASSFTRRFTPARARLFEFEYLIDGDNVVRRCCADSFDTAREGVERLANNREFLLELRPGRYRSERR